MWPGAIKDSARFAGRQVRDYLLKRTFKPEHIVPFCYRPFDVRWLYWEPETKLLDEKREDYFTHIFDGNVWLSSAQRNRRHFDPPYVASQLCCLHVIEWSANFFPMLLKGGGLLNARIEPNVSGQSSEYAVRLDATPADVFFHAIAVCHAPAYAADNAGALLQNWPRIPVPTSREALRASACIGKTVAQLLDPERSIQGVTSSLIRPELRLIGVNTCAAGHLDPDSGDLEVTASWGYAGKGGAVMPPQGRAAERPYDLQERRRKTGLRPFGAERGSRVGDSGRYGCRRLLERSSLLERHTKAGVGVQNRRLPSH